MGDNVSINKSIIFKLGITLIGCASHRFNLAVPEIIGSSENFILKVHKMMMRFKGLLLYAKPRKLALLRPKTKKMLPYEALCSRC